MDTKQRLTVFLPSNLIKEIKIQALREGRPLSDVIAIIVEDYLLKYGVNGTEPVSSE